MQSPKFINLNELMNDIATNSSEIETLTLRQQLRLLVDALELRKIRELLLGQPPADIAEIITEMSNHDQAVIFRIMPRALAADVFEHLEFEKQKELLSALSDQRVAVILNDMSPDDRTDFLEEFPASAARQLVTLLSKEERAIALTLLGYPENSVGRLMSPDYIAVRPEWSIAEILKYVREHAKETDDVHAVYLVDDKGKLLDRIRIRDILLAPLEKCGKDLMNERVIALKATDDQETAVQVFKKYDRTALPVVDSQQILLGLVTIDDVLDVAEEEATEDIQKIGGSEALEDPYIQVSILTLVRKRASWLVLLFIGEMLTATAMGFYESQIAKAVILALFIPLIISSGGNSGSQASTLIIRALAIGEISLLDWWKVMRREIFTGLCLGSILGIIGFLRVAIWAEFTNIYGPHWIAVGLVVGFSLLAVVLWGTISGAMLPFLLKRLGLDPATSSAPFVATIVDVTGLVIYFTIASYLLTGKLL